jgi:hypothetical protein
MSTFSTQKRVYKKPTDEGENAKDLFFSSFSVFASFLPSLCRDSEAFSFRLLLLEAPAAAAAA